MLLRVQFALVECVVSTIKDELGAFLGKDRLSDIILRLLIFVFSFFCALPMIMYGGIYILTLIDEVISTFPLLIIGLLEIIVFVWIYGVLCANHVHVHVSYTSTS